MFNRNKIAIGTVQFGLDYGISNFQGKTTPKEAEKILNYAQNHGIKILDTASAYGDSQQVLGMNNLTGFQIISKFTSSNKEDLLNEFNSTISKLGVHSIYGYLAHKSEHLVKNPEIWEALVDLKAQKKIQKIGISFNEISEVNNIKKHKILPDIIQIPYNYFDNRFKEVAESYKESGVEIHSRSSFLQGLFFLDKKHLESNFKEVQDMVIWLQNEHKERLSGFLLKYCLEKPFIDSVVIGVNNLEQLKQNIKGIDVNYDYDNYPFSKDIPEHILIPSQWNKKSN